MIGFIGGAADEGGIIPSSQMCARQMRIAERHTKYDKLLFCSQIVCEGAQGWQQLAKSV